MAHSAQIKLSTVLPVILLIVGIIIGFAVGFAVRPPAPTPTATPSPSPTVKVIKITVWASGSPVDITRVDNIERAASILNRMFEAAGVPVKIEVEKQFFRGDYMEKLTAAFAAGEAPDIIAMKNLPVLADGGYIIALDGYVEKYKDLLNDVYPVLWNAVKYKGKIWALPQDTEARPLYFRKDVLRQLGWSEEEIEALPEKIENGEVTLLDLIEVAKEAMDKGLVQWGFYHRPNFGGTPFVILYYQYGGILQDPETGKLVLDKSAMLKMLELLYRMAQVDKVLPPTMIGTSWRQIHADFVNGRVLFWFGGTWHWAEWQRVAYHEELGELPEEYEWENIGFALVPAPEPGLKPMTLSSPYLYYVTAQAEEPEIAFLLIELATSAPIDAIHSVDSGHLPVRSTTVEQPYYKQSKFHREVAYMLEYTSFEPLHPKWGAYKDAWITAITKVEKGEVTPEEALDEMVETLKAELGDELIIRD
ncbi:MAG: ABC transporter substrate-binding protein [Desulfurococcales archaeon ex4484_217_1]|nr:MAG: ABC transporter substrate-binding protein [Desulfurococcales archaeon ex4484_217_1]